MPTSIPDSTSLTLRALSSAPYATPHWSGPPPDQLPKAERGPTRRRRWAAVALILSLLAVVVEAVFHLCASALFDPLPDALTGVAYAWVLFTLAFNEAALGAATQPSRNPLILALGPKRAAGFALAGTGVALLVAAMVTWMFLPFLAAAPLLLISVVGTLLLAPCLDLVVLIAQFRALRALSRSLERTRAGDSRRGIGVALLGAMAVLFLIVRPALIGRGTAQALHTTGDAQQRAFAELRFLHGESTMLDLTYRRNPPYWVCFGYKAGTEGLWPWVGYTWQGLGDDVPLARRDYFLMTGTPFESVPRPDSAERQNELGQPDDVAVEETGGYVVGRPVPGLSLDASVLAFTVDAQTETTVGDWTLTFRNDTAAPQEARADILLPPGGTCHAVSLWINGVEEPAAFSSPQKVRTAYQQVAVVRRRDPLLVTMPAPDHLLVQCFPVPANATMKIKLGITAPLTWRSAIGDTSGSSRLLWTAPTFGTVNFTVPSRLTHSLTLQTASGATLPAPVLRGADLFSPPTVSVPTARNAPHVGDELAPGITRTDDPTETHATPVTLYLLWDASQGMDDALTSTRQNDWYQAVAALPRGSHAISEDTTGSLFGDMYPFDVHPRYVGGTDPALALERMLRRAREAQATTHQRAVVVFLHAASPANVSDLGGVRRELQRSAAVGGPALVSIALAPQAPDAVAMDLAGFSRVYTRRALPGDDGALADALRFAVQTAQTPVPAPTTCPLGGHAPAVNGIELSNTSVTPVPEPLALLRQSSQTTADWYRANAMANFDQSVDLRIAAGAPAARARLITPLTSAIVLETVEQYTENGLDDPPHQKNAPNAKKADAEPQFNAPEPPASLLAAVGIGALLGSRIFFARSRPIC